MLNGALMQLTWEVTKNWIVVEILGEESSTTMKQIPDFILKFIETHHLKKI